MAIGWTPWTHTPLRDGDIVAPDVAAGLDFLDQVLIVDGEVLEVGRAVCWYRLGKPVLRNRPEGKAPWQQL